MDRVINQASGTVRNVYFILLVFLLIAMVSLVITFKAKDSTDTKLTGYAEQLIDLASTNKQILQTLLDCTQPEGTCSKRNQAGTAEAVGGINAITMAAAVCADEPESTTVLQMRDCVKTILDADGDKP